MLKHHREGAHLRIVAREPGAVLDLYGGCGESEFPVLPTAAIRCPRVTDWPGRTSALPRAALRSLT